ncbi:hypothetical protein BH10BDE1_BH10BDE1_24620 [soil metagenome]
MKFAGNLLILHSYDHSLWGTSQNLWKQSAPSSKFRWRSTEWFLSRFHEVTPAKSSHGLQEPVISWRFHCGTVFQVSWLNVLPTVRLFDEVPSRGTRNA